MNSPSGARVGERVKHARNFHGWTQTELASQIGVTQPAISQIEKTGQCEESTLQAIASATGYGVDFFFRKPLPDLDAGSLRWRKRARSTQRGDERIRAHVRQAIEVLQDLETAGTGPPVRIRPIDPDETVDVALLEAVADEARQAIGVDCCDPIPNLVRAVERAGVVVIGSAQNIETHDGATYWPDFPRGRPVICISRGRPGDAQRMSVAHELGHLYLHQTRIVLDRKVAEKEAFHFAGALLLPREAADDEIELPVTLRALAHTKARYGISIAGLIQRCFTLGLIDEARRTSLFKQLSARGWRKHEPVEVPNESPTLLREFTERVVGTSRPNQLARRFHLPPMAMADLIA